MYTKKTLFDFIEIAYSDIFDDYLRSQLLGDFKLECFCRGYICCLDTICTFYNILPSKKVLDKRKKLDL